MAVLRSRDGGAGAHDRQYVNCGVELKSCDSDAAALIALILTVHDPNEDPTLPSLKATTLDDISKVHI